MGKYGQKSLMTAVVLHLLTISTPIEAQVGFTWQSAFSYLKGKDAANLPSDWMSPSFDYTLWPSGNAPFRYGDGEGGTELGDMQGSYSTIYLRSTFAVANSSEIKELTFSVDFDDGFIIWINGKVALGRNIPAIQSWNAYAPENHESGIGEEFTISAAGLDLTDGTNQIAVMGFNISLTSSDFYFDIAISGEKYLPEFPVSSTIDFSSPSGFFSAPFSLILSSVQPGAKIIYTLDGSNPQTSTTSFTVTSPAAINIDPGSSYGRPLTPCVVLRASLTDDGYKPSKPASRTFIYIDGVKNQKWPGAPWPGINVNGQIIDLPMDGDVVNDPEYSGLIDDALLDIPSISIITDPDNLFDPASGIYVNAMGHGLQWERECSVELVNPDGSPGFNVNAGLRIRGGWSRNSGFPKHGFRLFFREKYGNDKLRFPLFGDEGVSQFDKIDLRTEQNYAWSNGFPTNSLVREVFSRDSQKDLGQPYTRSRYYHLYLNGMYWGVFQSQERSEARYAQSYFGDSEEDYDVIKVNTENGYNVEVTDGNIASWKTLWDMCQAGFSSNEDYFRIEGRDKTGKPVKGGKIMVDIDNLIDFMMVIFYTGNFDSPTASFMQNKGSNNFYAIDNRKDNSTGFTFFVHDAEHSMFDEAHPPGAGLYEDRVNIGTRTDNMKMEVSSLNKFHPQWLHFKLSENPEYRLRFADRAWLHLTGDGVFTPGKSLERLEKRIREVETAVIAESARWGDAKTSSGYPFTKNDNWLPEVNKIRNKFIPYRTPIVIGQLKKAGLFPEIDAPVIKLDGTPVNSGQILLNRAGDVVIENPNTSGTIYYTLDGTDPRKVGGGITLGARFSVNDVNLPVSSSARINARVFSGGKWSAARCIDFISDREDYSGLKLTELHYHPPDLISGTDTIPGQDLEFIEFKNTGVNSVNLSGLVIDSAIYYAFPVNTLLAPRQFWVIASKPAKFYDYYGMVASGNFQGNLSNGGEEILLNGPGNREILNFTYLDSYPWPDAADGEGFSLHSNEVNPTGDPGTSTYWTLSVRKDGTPFADNLLENGGGQAGDQVNSLVVYPNPSKGIITVQFTGDEEVTELRLALYDIMGRLVTLYTTGNPGMVDLSMNGFPDGIYTLKMVSGKYSSTARIVLSR